MQKTGEENQARTSYTRKELPQPQVRMAKGLLSTQSLFG